MLVTTVLRVCSHKCGNKLCLALGLRKIRPQLVRPFGLACLCLMFWAASLSAQEEPKVPEAPETSRQVDRVNPSSAETGADTAQTSPADFEEHKSEQAGDAATPSEREADAVHALAAETEGDQTLTTPDTAEVEAGSAQFPPTKTEEHSKGPQKNPFPVFYWHINAQYINDFQNGNLVTVMDDRYTYGITTIFSLNNWDLFFHYRSLTDRYESETRMDELQIGLSYTLGNFLNQGFWQKFWSNLSAHYNRRVEGMYSQASPFYLGATFSTGYFQAGDILGQRIQNKLHEVNKVPKIYGDYLKSVYTGSIGAELYFAYTFPLSDLLPLWEDTLWQLGARTNAETAIGYQESFSLGLRSKLYSGNQYLQFDFYIQQLGYYNGFGLSNTVESLWSDTKTAFWLAFSSRIGLYQRRVDMSFGSLSNPEGENYYPFGFGSLEFSWASLQKKKNFVQADFSQSILMGLSINNNLVLDRYSFFFRLAERIPSDFSFLVVRDLTGDPRLFFDNSLAREAEAAWLGMLHLRPTLDLKKFGFLEFYAGIGAGLLTMEFPSSIEQLGPRRSFQFFTLAGEAGLRWYGLALRRDGAVYGIEVALFSMFPFTDRNSTVRFDESGLLTYVLQPRLNFVFGLSVLTDW